MSEKTIPALVLFLVLIIAFIGLYFIVKAPGQAYKIIIQEEPETMPPVVCCCYAVDDMGQLVQDYDPVETYKGDLYGCNDACRMAMKLPRGIHAQGTEGNC